MLNIQFENTLILDNWEITNAFGQYLQLEENSISECCLRGEKRVGCQTWHVIRPTHRLSSTKDINFVRVLTDQGMFILGYPNPKYARLFNMTTARFAEVVTKKLNLI
jgi:hypothetical protein